MSEDEKANYERSYKRMWDDINRARRQRDNAIKFQDAARDLVISMEHDCGSGLTKVSLQTHDALNRLKSRLAEHAP